MTDHPSPLTEDARTLMLFSESATPSGWRDVPPHSATERGSKGSA